MRQPDWEVRLAEVVDDARTRQFGWGTFDCCTFAADAVHALTGQDPMRCLRGRYADFRSALRLQKTLGGLRAAVSDILGNPLTAPRLAQRGDIVMVRTKVPALGVVVGQSALVPLVHGVQRVPMGDWAVAWRVE